MSAIGGIPDNLPPAVKLEVLQRMLTAQQSGISGHPERDRFIGLTDDQVSIRQILNEVVKGAPADNSTGRTLLGAGLGASLPSAALLDYELRQRPGFNRLVDDIVDRAAKEDKIWVGTSRRKPSMHPLRSRMQLGDVILQSHKGEGKVLRQLLSGNPDFTDLSLGGSGGPFAHAGISSRTGQIVDPGKFDYDTPMSNITGRIRAWLTGDKFEGEKWKTVRDTIRPDRQRGESVHRYLGRVGYDPMSVASKKPELSLVMRPDNLKGVSEDRIAHMIAREQQIPYGRGRAALAGAKRIFFPGVDMLGRMRPRSQNISCHGTFCSDGANRLLQLLGHDTKRSSNVLPTDLAKPRPGVNLVGIGINRSALDAAKGSGLTGSALKAEAARTQMKDVLRSAAGTRRALGGLAIGLGALLGGVTAKATG